MTNQHPITPPPELVQQWLEEADTFRHLVKEVHQYIATRAAQWGADMELEACCEQINEWGGEVEAEKLRTLRRLNPPSLKEQALTHFESYAATFETVGGDSDLIRRALEQLDD